MNSKSAVCILISIFNIVQSIQVLRVKHDNVYAIKRPRGHWGNPGWLHDRIQNASAKLDVDPEILPPEQPYHPAWADYCAQYHCNDYHKPACGLNRPRKEFKWFQSGCHLILNNQCARLTGFVKYDFVDAAYCRAYVQNLRSTCSEVCTKMNYPVCGKSKKYGYSVFTNRCLMINANCQLEDDINEYIEVAWNKCLPPLTIIPY